MKRPVKPEFINISLHDKKGSGGTYDIVMSQPQQRPVCENRWAKV